ncbi:hypothetical protein HDK90DRAFT_127857 [Phyllosticta capitalensis]|uniref:Uncharacterized protein n=1 Tax=Phyllosticta capitalensis TaxID=121624 RepID=A0ABR1YZ57_9PEZI
MSAQRPDTFCKQPFNAFRLFECSCIQWALRGWRLPDAPNAQVLRSSSVPDPSHKRFPPPASENFDVGSQLPAGIYRLWQVQSENGSSNLRKIKTNAKITTRRAEPLVQGLHRGENRGIPRDSTALSLHRLCFDFEIFHQDEDLASNGTHRTKLWVFLTDGTCIGGASRARNSPTPCPLSFGSLSSLILSNILCLILPAKRLTAIRATNEVSTKCNAANGPGNTVKGYPEFDSAEITSLRRDCYKRIYRTKKILQRKYVQIDKGVCSVSTVSGATAAVPSCRLGAPQMWQSVSAHFIASGMSKSERQIFNSDEVEIQVLLAVSVRKVERGLPSIYTYI